jgi:hypothetical protein
VRPWIICFAFAAIFRAKGIAPISLSVALEIGRSRRSLSAPVVPEVKVVFVEFVEFEDEKGSWQIWENSL